MPSFVQKLAPGAAKRLGLDAASLVARCPRLIGCDIFGYGTGGSDSRRKSYDLLVRIGAVAPLRGTGTDTGTTR